MTQVWRHVGSWQSIISSAQNTRIFRSSSPAVLDLNSADYYTKLGDWWQELDIGLK